MWSRAFISGPVRSGPVHEVVQVHHLLGALSRRLTFQSSRAICAALAMQTSLGGRPHRSDRSQSAQLKSGRRSSATIVCANLAKMPSLRLASRMASSFVPISARRRPRCFDKYQFGPGSGATPAVTNDYDFRSRGGKAVPGSRHCRRRFARLTRPIRIETRMPAMHHECGG